GRRQEVTTVHGDCPRAPYPTLSPDVWGEGRVRGSWRRIVPLTAANARACLHELKQPECTEEIRDSKSESGFRISDLGFRISDLTLCREAPTRGSPTGCSTSNLRAFARSSIWPAALRIPSISASASPISTCLRQSRQLPSQRFSAAKTLTPSLKASP